MISTSCSTSFASGFIESHYLSVFIGGRVALSVLCEERIETIRFSSYLLFDSNSMVSICPGEHGATQPSVVSLFQILLLNRFYLIHARSVMSAREFSGQPGFDNLLGEVQADQTRAQSQHICIVMLTAIHRGRVIIRHSRPHARDFVRDNAASYACAIDHDASPGFSRTNQLSDSMSEIRIVHRILAIRTYIIDFDT